ncbi:tRNA-uridine aminocarboxypropyltransferase [Vibrio amylolyticus]|uniref:tRNA-uridine aminocarboxypropyltransferase n=1 Tax=Vibrio TaxID=662 RepID=UPI001F52B889|nr:DTW domain-containing protein [Vibrio sp. 10N.261.55.A7]
MDTLSMIYRSTQCPKCELTQHCVCDDVPRIHSPVHIALLMHENELKRETNTGRWLMASLDKCSQHVWQRKVPNQSLIDLIELPHVVPMILYPSEQSQPVTEVLADLETLKRSRTLQGEPNLSQPLPLFIILDGTWQEAKKIAKKISWLSQCQHVHLVPTSQSSYGLRRNQEEGHLCTLEVAAELLNLVGERDSASQLTEFFLRYMAIYKADKSGHPFKESERREQVPRQGD